VATLGAVVTTPAGVPVARGQSQRVTAAPAGKMLREGFRTDFDLSRLTPGRYVLTLEAASGRDRKRTTTRQIPFRHRRIAGFLSGALTGHTTARYERCKGCEREHSVQ
jgi:hypothetical protein